MNELIHNKTVNVVLLVEQMKRHMLNYHTQDVTDISDIVDEFIQQNIEIPASEAAGIDFVKADIYEIIDNVDELRDAQNDFIETMLTPSGRCKMAGLKSLAELVRITGVSEQTLINWHRSRPQLFAVIVAGAAQVKAQ